MKKKILMFGYSLFFSGIVLFGLMHVAISIYLPHLTDWSSPPGKIGQILTEIGGWVPYLFSILFIIVGISIIIYDLSIAVRENNQHKE